MSVPNTPKKLSCRDETNSDSCDLGTYLFANTPSPQDPSPGHMFSPSVWCGLHVQLSSHACTSALTFLLCIITCAWGTSLRPPPVAPPESYFCVEEKLVIVPENTLVLRFAHAPRKTRPCVTLVRFQRHFQSVPSDITVSTCYNFI